MPIQDILRAKLEGLYDSQGAIVLERMGQVLEPKLPGLVDDFYAELMEMPEIAPILSHSIVHKNLKNHLQIWLRELFRARNSAQVEEMIERQKKVGLVHANLKISLNYFTHGISILKREIYGHLHRMLAGQNDFAEAFLILGQVFDLLVSIIADAYMSSELVHEANVLSLKMKRVTPNTAIECERLRSLLLDWLRNVLTLLYQAPEINSESLPKLQYSAFGLWVIYKSDLISPTVDVSTELRRHIETIDEAFLAAARCRRENNDREFFDSMVALNDAVTKASWYVSSVVDELMELDFGLDPLTRLYNRRYLETILRRHTDISLRLNMPYCILELDMDQFKQVNDGYGHASGDLVLKQFAEDLLLALRVSDFIFRYGGDEFLVVLGNTRAADAMAIAERLRQRCSQRWFQLAGAQPIRVTCSIGLANFTGHPDYTQIIQRADTALYEAKGTGGNRIVLAN